MEKNIYTAVQIREVFHLEFLRLFSRKVDVNQYALKGGVNLRFFFKSIRYSEDMDIDIRRVGVEKIKKVSMDILTSKGFTGTLRYFGVDNVIPPDIVKAKQTDTTQRFKIHLITTSGEDLFTKIEFSRRGFNGAISVEPIFVELLRFYKMPPLLVPHYTVSAAVQHKIQALVRRTVLQARDIFDLFFLSSQFDMAQRGLVKVGKTDLATAMDNVFRVELPFFRDSVVAYLESEDQKIYSSSAVLDEVKLKVLRFLEEFRDDIV